MGMFDSLQGIGDIPVSDLVVIAPGRRQSCLVHEVSEIRAHHARCHCRDHRQIHVEGQGNRPSVDGEDRLAAAVIGWIDEDVAVEPTRTKQRTVEHLGSVGGRQHDHTFAPREPVHLGQDLIEGLFALVVAAHARTTPAGSTDGIELVDEHDRWGRLFGLIEEITNPAGAQRDHTARARSTMAWTSSIALMFSSSPGRLM